MGPEPGLVRFCHAFYFRFFFPQKTGKPKPSHLLPCRSRNPAEPSPPSVPRILHSISIHGPARVRPLRLRAHARTSRHARAPHPHGHGTQLHANAHQARPGARARRSPTRPVALARGLESNPRLPACHTGGSSSRSRSRGTKQSKAGVHIEPRHAPLLRIRLTSIGNARAFRDRTVATDLLGEEKTLFIH